MPGERLLGVAILQPAIDLLEYGVDCHERVGVLRFKSVEYLLITCRSHQTDKQKRVGTGSPFQVVPVDPFFGESAGGFPPVDQLGANTVS